MAIFRRIADMLSANLNDLIERIEDPEALLRQAVREMESAVEQTMSAAAKSIASERLLTRQVEDYRRQSAVLLERAKDAVAQQDDRGARELLAERRRYEQLAGALDDQLVSTRAQNSRLRRQLDALRLRLAEARQTMHVHIARNRASRAQRELATDAWQLHCGDAAFERFDRLCGRIERSDAETEAYLELAGAGAGRFNAAETEVDAELAALKEQVGVQM